MSRNGITETEPRDALQISIAAARIWKRIVVSFQQLDGSPIKAIPGARRAWWFPMKRQHLQPE